MGSEAPQTAPVADFRADAQNYKVQLFNLFRNG